ncbi:hypothetical protein IWZ01DRAFT_570833 [Phyllosticta capitalensis]
MNTFLWTAISNPQENLGRTFEWLCEQAWSASNAGNHEEGYRQARRLLLEPQLGDFLQANCHLLLTSSDDKASVHGEEAVALYQKLIDKGGPGAPLGYYNDLLAEAKRLLERARAREAEERQRWAGMTDSQVTKAKVEEILDQLKKDDGEAGPEGEEDAQ